MRNLLKSIAPLVDVLLFLPTLLAAAFLKVLRALGIKRLPLSKRALMLVGIFPIQRHYYEPQFDYRDERLSLREERRLPGIDWNVEGQRSTLRQMTYQDELARFASPSSDPLAYSFANDAFLSGDAEYWYQTIRLRKPRRIIEIGSGHSTRMARHALLRNRAEDASYVCEHICVEPYEAPWLESLGVTVSRTRVEDLGVEFFAGLERNDILFIDSSHIIRPHGDVTFEYLELLPTLSPGVLVHVHDIFSPRNYIDEWLKDDVRFWNEQYLLEAFLSHNKDWKIVGALNFLHHSFPAELKRVCPFLTPAREPGSFYLERVQ